MEMVASVLGVPDWLLLLVTMVGLFYWYHKSPHYALKRLGLDGPPPALVFGNLKSYLTEKLPEMDTKHAKLYGKVYGFFEGRNPTIVTSDINIVKQVLVKSFENFPNRRHFHFNGIFEGTLTEARDDDWRFKRHLLSPAFTTGKLRQMMPLISDCCEVITESLVKRAQEGTEFDVMKPAGSFAMEAIAAVGFGVKINSQENPDDPFVKNIENAITPKVNKAVFLLLRLFPFLRPLVQKTGYCILQDDAIQFYINLTRQTIAERKSGQSSSPDLLHLMMKAHEQHVDAETEREARELSPMKTTALPKRGLTLEEMTGQSIMFFGDGWAGVTQLMAALMHLLAINPDCQQTLLDEIDSVLGEKGSDITEEKLSQLKYLEMCLYEASRIYPALHRIDRTCEEDIIVQGLLIPSGTLVQIPVYVLHHDPEVWPQPDQFRPDRWSPEAVQSRDSHYFLGWGAGPRMCIGRRLAQMEIKMAFARILQEVKFVSCSKTKDPLEMAPGPNLNFVGGVWLKAERRN